MVLIGYLSFRINSNEQQRFECLTVKNWAIKGMRQKVSWAWITGRIMRSIQPKKKTATQRIHFTQSSRNSAGRKAIWFDWNSHQFVSFLFYSAKDFSGTKQSVEEIKWYSGNQVVLLAFSLCLFLCKVCLCMCVFVFVRGQNWMSKFENMGIVIRFDSNTILEIGWRLKWPLHNLDTIHLMQLFVTYGVCVCVCSVSVCLFVCLIDISVQIKNEGKSPSYTMLTYFTLNHLNL